MQSNFEAIFKASVKSFIFVSSTLVIRVTKKAKSDFASATMQDYMNSVKGLQLLGSSYYKVQQTMDESLPPGMVSI